MNSEIKIKGTVRIYEEGKLISEYENLVMRPVKASILNILTGGSPMVGSYAFLAIGSDSKPPIATDTTLGSEFFRKPVTNVERLSNTRLIVETYVENEEANGHWYELGLYDNSGEWTTPNSGILLNRAAISEEKNSGSSKTVSWTIDIL